MHALEVKGKSTGANLRAVYVLIDRITLSAIERLLKMRPDRFVKSNYLFAR